MWGLKYKEQWVQVTRHLGGFVYKLVDDYQNATYPSQAKAKAARAVFASDNNIPVSEIEIQEVML